MPVRNHRPVARDEKGATATEYGILVFFLVLALVGGVSIFGNNLNDVYNALAQWVQDTL